MKLPLNREFALRYTFTILVFGGLSCWFAFDGFVKYPRMEAAALYESIEGSAPPETLTAEKLEAFKNQKRQSQIGLAAVTGVASLWVLAILLSAVNKRLEYDETGFSVNGRKIDWSAVTGVDRGKWEKKGIVLVKTADSVFTFDGWHHSGMDGFEKMLKEKTGK